MDVSLVTELCSEVLLTPPQMVPGCRLVNFLSCTLAVSSYSLQQWHASHCPAPPFNLQLASAVVWEAR